MKRSKNQEGFNMFKIGCHLSSSKGYVAMGKEAVAIGANTFQFFTRNPRGGTAKPLDLVDIGAYQSFAAMHNLQPILAHAPYTLNACAADAGLRQFALDTIKDDLERLDHIPGSMYNFHPGSHVKQGEAVGIQYIADMLNAAIPNDLYTTILLETMAGKGTEIGRRFEELQEIIGKVDRSDVLGVCLDTCHIFEAGYDIVNDLENVLSEFDRIIGLGRLKAIHLNDSKNPIGSRKDRHEKIGDGSIGTRAITAIINHPLLRELPFYLETPNDVAGYKKEIELLKSLYVEVK